MTNQLRSTTNLVVPEHLRLDKKEMKRRFMYVYSGAAPGPEPLFMNRLWLSYFFPDIAKDPSFGKNRKGIRTYFQHFEKYQKAGLLKLKKINDPSDPHFVVAVPLTEFNRYDLNNYLRQLRFWFTDGAMPDNVEHEQALNDELKQNQEGEIQQKQVMASEVIPLLGLDANSTLALKECFLGLRLQFSGGLAVIYGDFKITKAEAQQLTTTDWAMIRNMDMYPLLLQWQISGWGFKGGGAPLSSFPLSTISKTLPPVREGQARVNEYGLSIAPDGAVLWLPEKLDNTSRYEDRYAQVGDKGDDTFGLIDIYDAGEAALNGTDLHVRLPANIPVLIDWVNNRYAYTQSNGVLKVQDLTRFKTCDAAHAANILKHWILEKKQAQMFMEMGKEAGVPDALYFTEEEIKEIQKVSPGAALKLSVGGSIDLETYWDAAYEYWANDLGLDEKTFCLADISIEDETYVWRPLARYIEIIQAAVIQNMDSVNQRFSVSGVAARLGTMTLIAKYGNELTVTRAKSNAIRAAAINQSVDPNWRPDAVPLLMDNPDRPFSVLPHQMKVMNLMKESPDFAILPVQAGGGKTPLAILDILKELKAGRGAPYLVMCPSPLVPQYVNEITYFTSGQVNCIPIMTDVFLRNGMPRLKAMIESSPRNTIVIVNYDVLRNKAYDVCYGTTNVTIYPIIEFLRQFNFGYAMMDESHNLKNDSQRTRAALQLIADIPKKRLASGTMAHDSPSDLALQVAMLDPTLFGSRDAFNKRFGAVVKGGRVIEWQPGAQQQIMTMIKSRIVVAKAMRKEWAALLPTAKEEMHLVKLTDAQYSVYQAILTEAFDKMKEDAKGNPALKKFFENAPAQLGGPGTHWVSDMAGKGNEGANEEVDEEAEDDADESAGEDLEALLGFYLARLEQFLTAPGKDELGARLLQGDDLRSPKVNKILEIVQNHINSGIEGKVLIFTNYIDSAEEIYEAADPALRAQGILYTAGEKVEAGAQFEGDNSKRWMVGVENSMNTGLNFQHVSRLIRVENVWNPGTMEQGNARINRPQLKAEERRKNIFFDWIAADRTYDVTKISRLISKIIAVAKFENTENPEYEDLPDLPVIPMSADAIIARNTREDLIEYAMAYKSYNTVKQADYDEYRAKHGGLTMTPLRIAPRPNDAAIMAQVPYVPGTELYKGSEHGLIRVDEYIRVNDIGGADMEEGGDDKDDSDSSEIKELTPKQRHRAALAKALIGMHVHTEFGDGIVKSISLKRKRLNFSLPSGYLARVKFSAAFVIKPGALKEMTMREQIMKGVSQDMPVIAPVNLLGPEFRPDKAGVRHAEKMRKQVEKEEVKIKKAEEVVNALNVELGFAISNGFLSIVYYPEDDSNAGAALQALGFRPEEPYVFAEIHTPQQLVQQFKKWKEEDFSFDPKFEKMSNASAAIRDLHAVMKKGTLHTGVMNYRFANRNQLQNFFRMELKPSTSNREFKVYPMIEDGGAYLVMHTRGQPATKAAMQVRSPGIRWQVASDRLAYYGLTPEKTAAKMREIIASGIQIMNLKELQLEFRKLKKQGFRNSEVPEQH